ncbi:MAG: acetyltransferase [Cyanobacteria bacterium P01_A01_bin.15]
MFVKLSNDKTLVEVLDIDALFNPFETEIQGRQQSGQSAQPPSAFNKTKLIFPSGEPLPQCWIDPDYQQKK